MRRDAVTLSKEALDSVDGMDLEEAWALREEHWRQWPSTALSSLRHLAITRRGEALIDRVLAANPQRIAVLRNAYGAIARRPAAAGTERAPGAIRRGWRHHEPVRVGNRRGGQSFVGLNVSVMLPRMMAAAFIGFALALRPWRLLMKRPLPRTEMIDAQILLCAAEPPTT